MRTLYGLSQSPWSEKARWALDHHSIAYRYHEHVPLLGEVFLRLKARSRPKGTKASVPLLVDGAAAFCSSLAIAQHAEHIGRGSPLFPKEERDTIASWAELSDRIIGAGRTRVLAGLRSNKEAQREALPSFVPHALRGALSPMTVSAALFLRSKYDISGDAEAEAESILRPALDEIHAALAANREGTAAGYLGKGFTFSDLAVASSLQALRPREHSALGPATREIWSNESLAERYADLLAWRDEIYAKHRPGA